MTSQHVLNGTPDFKALFEASPGLYLILLPDEKFTITAVSNSYAAATMTAREQIIGKGLFEVFPDNPDDKFADGENNLRHSLSSVLKNKTDHTMAVQKYDIRRPDGTFEVRWWSPINKPVLGEKGEVRYIIHRVEDVTQFIKDKADWVKKDKHIEGLERKVSEMEMEVFARAQKIQQMNRDLEQNVQQLKEYQHFFNNSNDLCGIANTGGFFEIINNKFEKVLGYTDSEFLAHPFFHFIHPDDLPATQHEVEKLKQGATTINFENRYKKKDGTYVWLEWHSTPDTATGKLYAIARDITERKKAQEQLTAANKELEAFSYSVSHDLRAPLRAVNGFADMLMQQSGATLDENAKRLLGVIKTNALGMGQLIDDLLSFSRTGRKEVQLVKTDMNSMAYAVVSELCQNDAQRMSIFTINKLPYAQCDTQLMRQVWQNLISNAWKYSSKKEKPEIEIGAEEKGSEIIYYVKDNGAGFDMQYASKLFGVFQRLHSQKEFEGNGVGLALVQRIIAKHEGKVWAEAELDKGATFYFTLKG